MTDTLSTTESAAPRTVDPDRLDAFLGSVISDLGATISAGLVVLGDRLGLYAAMRGGEPVTTEELADAHRHLGDLPRAVAGQPGRRRLRAVRRRNRHLVDDAGTGGRPRRPGEPGLLHRQHAAGTRRAARRTRDRAALPDRPRLRLARARRQPVQRHRAVLPSRLRRQPRPGVAAGARRRGAPSRGGCRGDRRRVRPRRLDHPDGPGLRELPVRRPGLPRGFHRGRPSTGRGGAGLRPGPVRGRRRGRPARGPGVPGHHVRLPARHGRPGQCGPRRTPCPRRRRHLPGRRTDGGGSHRGEPAPRGQDLLRRLDPGLHAVARSPSRASGRWEPRPVPPSSPRCSRTPASAGSGWPTSSPVNLIIEARP